MEAEQGKLAAYLGINGMSIPEKKPTVYIETSIVSLLNRRPSHNTIEVARQILTHQWWDEQSSEYQLVTSQYVMDEAAAGDPDMARARLMSLEGIPLLLLDEKIGEVAAQLIENAVLSPKSTVDALHISIAAFHRIEYLIDLELQSYCQREDSTQDQASFGCDGDSNACDLHTSGDGGK